MSQSITKNIVSKVILDVFNIVIPIILVPYVYRVLGRECIGNVEYTTTLYTYFMILGLMGIYNYGLRGISGNRNDQTKVQYIYKNLFTIGIVTNTIAFILYILFLTYVIKDDTVRLLGYIFSANIVAQIFYVEWVNEAFEEFKFITIKTICIRLISIVSIIFMVKSAKDVYLYVLILTFVYILNYVVSFIYAQKRIRLSFYKTFTGLNLRQFIFPLLIIFILRNTDLLYTVVDRTLLGYYTGTDSVALFSVSQKIVEIIKTIILSVIFATLPRLSFYLQENKNLYQEGIIRVMRFVIMLALPMGIGLLMLAPQVVWLMAGDQFLGASLSLRIFALRMITLSIDFILYNQILFLHGKERVIIKFNIICGVLNVLLNYLFISILTPFYSILFTWCSEIIFLLLNVNYIHQNINISLGIFKRYNLKYLIASLMFIPIIFIIKLITINNVYIILISIFLCAVSYILILIKSKDVLFNYVINKMINPNRISHY